MIGAENIPLEGPVLIAPIHRSNVDFALTLFISKRKAFFMAKDSLFRVPLLGPLITHLGAFPIRRGSADRESMAHSEAVLRQGHALVFFPEGTRKEGPTVAPLHDGAMFVAARTGATVGSARWGDAQGANCPDRQIRGRCTDGTAVSEGRVSRRRSPPRAKSYAWR